MSGDGSDGADTIKITLRRRPGEEAEKLNLNGSIGQSVDTSDNSWQQLLNSWQDENYKLVDLQLDVTVTVEKGGESFAYTVTYDRAVHYAVAIIRWIIIRHSITGIEIIHLTLLMVARQL